MRKSVQLSDAQRALLTEESIGITRIDDSLLGLVAGGEGRWGMHPSFPGADTTVNDSCTPYTNASHTNWDPCP